MAVDVLTSRVGPSQDLVTENHSRGNKVQVSDGHLFVISGLDVVAIYAPTDWKNAVVKRNA